jgi:hypothetical protein
VATDAQQRFVERALRRKNLRQDRFASFIEDDKPRAGLIP